MLGTHANRHYTDHERRSVMRSRLAIGVCFAGPCDEKFESDIYNDGKSGAAVHRKTSNLYHVSVCIDLDLGGVPQDLLHPPDLLIRYT